jgi:hypothetical protein
MRHVLQFVRQLRGGNDVLLMLARLLFEVLSRW